MKLNCPTCSRKVDIGDASRYEVFTCGCGRQFRGTHADFAALDFFVSKYFTWRIKGYDSAYQTPCPHCGASIALVENKEFMGVYAPETCWACGKHLENSVVKRFTH